MENKTKSKNKVLKPPKISLNQLHQVVFTLRQVLKLAFKVKPGMLSAMLVINSSLGFFAIASFYLEKLILDNLVSTIGSSDLTPVFVSTVGLMALALGLSFLRNIMVSTSDFYERMLSRYFGVQMDVLIGKKIAELDMQTIEDPEFRDRLEKVQSEAGRRAWQLMSPLSQIPQSLFGFITASAVLLTIHPLLSLGVIVLTIPRVMVNHRYIKRRYKYHTETAADNRIWGWIRNYLVQNRNFLELKILGISDYLTNKLEKIGYKITDGFFHLGMSQIKARNWTYLPLTFLELGVSVFLVYWVLLQRITVGTFQLYLRSLRSVQDNLSQFAASFTSVYENYLYVTDLVWLLNTKPVISAKKGRKFSEDNIQIEFDGVWFKYRKDAAWVIKNMNFEINDGEKIAIVGENGAGKTTLIKLISRFYDPQKGEINLNGERLGEYAPESWRNNLAVLFQQFEHYPFTAREAIGYGDISRIGDLEKIKAVAKKVGIHDYIDALPLKYENPLAPELVKGVNPSTGQWQKIGIARMLFKNNAKLIILDEPTSNIDPEAEEKIFKELAKLTKGKVLIFVTQRFSTVRIADRIFVVDKGRIVEQGTHKELMALGGKYAKLYNLQAKAYENSS